MGVTRRKSWKWTMSRLLHLQMRFLFNLGIGWLTFFQCINLYFWPIVGTNIMWSNDPLSSLPPLPLHPYSCLLPGSFLLVKSYLDQNWIPTGYCSSFEAARGRPLLAGLHGRYGPEPDLMQVLHLQGVPLYRFSACRYLPLRDLTPQLNTEIHSWIQRLPLH